MYGTEGTHTENWSVNFASQNYDQFMFATGDCTRWIVTNVTFLGGSYSNQYRWIEQSSCSATPYQVKSVSVNFCQLQTDMMAYE